MPGAGGPEKRCRKCGKRNIPADVEACPVCANNSLQVVATPSSPPPAEAGTRPPPGIASRPAGLEPLSAAVSSHSGKKVLPPIVAPPAVTAAASASASASSSSSSFAPDEPGVGTAEGEEVKDGELPASPPVVGRMPVVPPPVPAAKLPAEAEGGAAAAVARGHAAAGGGAAATAVEEKEQEEDTSSSDDDEDEGEEGDELGELTNLHIRDVNGVEMPMLREMRRRSVANEQQRMMLQVR